MSKICYKEKRFSSTAAKMIDICNVIIGEYQQKGFKLTLRQVYYQCVARGFIPNSDKEYKKLGDIVSDARMAGMIDWTAIEDRGRFLRTLSHWESPEDIIGACADQFRLDRWTDQQYRVEVLVEKDALVGIVESACKPLDVPYMSCRGYNSQTAMWEMAQRMIKYHDEDQIPILLHLGDHDPSGIDMTRDITERLNVFLEYDGYAEIELYRIALNMDQVQQYQPPPNPAKLTDSRCQGYIKVHGNESWELDALKPEVLKALITEWIGKFFDDDVYDPIREAQRSHRDNIRAVADNWHKAVTASTKGDSDAND